MAIYHPRHIKKVINLANIADTDIPTIVSNNVSGPITKMRDENVPKATLSIIVTNPPDSDVMTWYESEYEWQLYPMNMTDTDISNLASEVESVLSGLKSRNVKECVLELLVT